MPAVSYGLTISAGMAEALDRALRMPLQERKERYENMMRAIRSADLAAWRDGFLRDLRASASRPTLISTKRAKASSA